MKNNKKDGSGKIATAVVLIIIWVIGGANFFIPKNAEEFGFMLLPIILLGGAIYLIMKGVKERKNYKSE